MTSQIHMESKLDFSSNLEDFSTKEHTCPCNLPCHLQIFFDFIFQILITDCSYSFDYKHVLERHISQIHEKHLFTNLQCPKCTYTTLRKDQLRSHYSVVHEDFKPFNCSICNFRAPKAYRVTVSILHFLLVFLD